MDTYRSPDTYYTSLEETTSIMYNNSYNTIVTIVTTPKNGTTIYQNEI